MPYEAAAIEAKWQAWWRENEVFRSELDPSKPKFYVLDMFPYPSGAGLHVGHPKGYIATDIVSRYKRMRGFNVLHPMGWDAFGLPAEQYAIETGTHPRETTAKNIATFKRQLRSLGLDYDWSREIDTTDPALREVDAVDLPPPVRARARLSRRGSGELVPRARHRARERRGDRRQERARRSSGRASADAPVDAPHHRLRRSPDRGPRSGRLARVDQEDAARLGGPVGGRADRVRGGGLAAADRGVHDAPRHAVRRHLPRARAGAPAGRRDHRAGTAQRRVRLRRADRAAQRAHADRGQREDRRCDRRVRDPPGHPCTYSYLDRRLRARELRHRRDHGGSRARRARLGVRARVRSADRRGGRGRRRRGCGVRGRRHERQLGIPGRPRGRRPRRSACARGSPSTAAASAP